MMLSEFYLPMNFQVMHYIFYLYVQIGQIGPICFYDLMFTCIFLYSITPHKGQQTVRFTLPNAHYRSHFVRLSHYAIWGTVLCRLHLYPPCAERILTTSTNLDQLTKLDMFKKLSVSKNQPHEFLRE